MCFGVFVRFCTFGIFSLVKCWIAAGLHLGVVVVCLQFLYCVACYYYYMDRKFLLDLPLDVEPFYTPVELTETCFFYLHSTRAFVYFTFCVEISNNNDAKITDWRSAVCAWLNLVSDQSMLICHRHVLGRSNLVQIEAGLLQRWHAGPAAKLLDPWQRFFVCRNVAEKPLKTVDYMKPAIRELGYTNWSPTSRGKNTACLFTRRQPCLSSSVSHQRPLILWLAASKTKTQRFPGAWNFV